MADKLASFDFSALVAAIRQTHEYMAAQAGRAVNISLTLRNWVNRQFYLTYPEIWQTASAESQRGLLPDPIWRTLSAKFAEAIPATIRKSLVSEFTAVARPTIRGSVTPELNRLLLAGMDNNLFVSKYQLELPRKEDIQRFLAQQLKEVVCGE